MRGIVLGVGCFDSVFKELLIKSSEINSGELKKLLIHEFTHLLGNLELKNGHITGYSSDPYYDYNDSQKMTNFSNNFFMNLIRAIIKKQGLKTEHVQFNEACVEMFTRDDEPLEEKSLKDCWNMDISLYTNFSVGSLYIFNANLVRQMITAQGIAVDDLFDGLFDYQHAKNVMKRFGKKKFDTMSKGMDRIYERVSDVSKTSYGSKEERVCLDKLEAEISIEEKFIIDQILLPKLAKMKGNDKQNVLNEYYKYIMFEQEYFVEKTGFVPSRKIQSSEERKFKEGLYVEACPIIISTKKIKDNGEKARDQNHHITPKDEKMEHTYE